MTIEECAELIVVLAKRNRKKNGSTYDEIVEELADVQIMINQLKIIFPIDEKLEEKLARLKKRLE